jgi:DIS3-like exonuclease 2
LPRYYTHFTSPIRRFADVMVHRLLQATLEGEDAVDNFVYSEDRTEEVAATCNERKLASKKAQERSDRVFLCLYGPPPFTPPPLLHANRILFAAT